MIGEKVVVVEEEKGRASSRIRMVTTREAADARAEAEAMAGRDDNLPKEKEGEKRISWATVKGAVVVGVGDGSVG